MKTEKRPWIFESNIHLSRVDMHYINQRTLGNTQCPLSNSQRKCKCFTRMRKSDNHPQAPRRQGYYYIQRHLPSKHWVDIQYLLKECLICKLLKQTFTKDDSYSIESYDPSIIECSSVGLWLYIRVCVQCVCVSAGMHVPQLFWASPCLTLYRDSLSCFSCCTP